MVWHYVPGMGPIMLMFASGIVPCYPLWVTMRSNCISKRGFPEGVAAIEQLRHNAKSPF